MANGTLMTPMPSSKGASWFAAALNVEMMVGATERCSQATGAPRPSTPASRCSTETVCRYELWRSSSRVHVTLTGLPPMAFDKTAASMAKSGLDFRPKPPPRSVTCTVTSSADMPRRFATRSRAGCGLVEVAVVAHDLARLARGLLERGFVADGIVRGVGAVVPGDLEGLPPLHRRPRVRRDDAHAAQRVELGGQRRLLDRHDLEHARHFEGLGIVDVGGLAAEH